MSKLLATLLLTLGVTAAQAENTYFIEGGVGYDKAVTKQVQTLEAGVKGDVSAFGIGLGKMTAGVEYAHSIDEYQKYGLFIGKPVQLGKTEVGVKAGLDYVAPKVGTSGYTMSYGLYALYPVTRSLKVGAEVRHSQNDIDAVRFQGTQTLVKAQYQF